jgi:hypothetical protein
MGSYTRPKVNFASGASNSPMPSSDLANYDDRELVWHEFERLGEEEVRVRIQYHVYDEQTSERARDWLAGREVINFGDDVRSVRAFARKASETASASHKIALAAQSLAQGSDSNAREAHDCARRAIAVTEATKREFQAGLWMNALAMVVAILALAVSIGAVVLR